MSALRNKLRLVWHVPKPLFYFQKGFLHNVQRVVVVPNVKSQGIVSVSLPLPGVAGLTDISFPTHETTIKHFEEKLIEMDPKLTSVELTDLNGTRYSKSTKLEHLKMGQFMFQLNDMLFSTSPVDAEEEWLYQSDKLLMQFRLRLEQENSRSISLARFHAISQELGITKSQENRILHELHRNRVIYKTVTDDIVIQPKKNDSLANETLDVQYKSMLEDIQIQQLEWSSIEKEIHDVEKLSETARDEVTRSLNARKWFGFLTLNGVFGGLAYCVWDVLSWDVMEPITYFLGFSVVVSSSWYHTLTKRDATYNNIWNSSLQKEKNKKLEKHNDRFEQLPILKLRGKMLKENIQLIKCRIGNNTSS